MREIANAPPPRATQFDAALRPPLNFDSRLVNIELALFLLRRSAERNLGGAKVLPRRYPFMFAIVGIICEANARARTLRILYMGMRLERRRAPARVA